MDDDHSLDGKVSVAGPHAEYAGTNATTTVASTQVAARDVAREPVRRPTR